MARRKGRPKAPPAGTGPDAGRGRGWISLQLLQELARNTSAPAPQTPPAKPEPATDPWALLAQAAVRRLRVAFLGYFPSKEGKLLAYEAGSQEGHVRVVLATPDVRAALGGKLPVEFSPAEMPEAISAAFAEMQRLEKEVGGPVSWWHEMDDLLREGQIVRLGLPEMEDPLRPHRRGPFGFALQRDPKGVGRVISVFNPKELPGAPKVGQQIDEITRMRNPSVGRKLLALAERWGYRLSEAVARLSR